ncbi:MAG: PHA/PHB synthase family protein [Gaiellaceae bacterium]
MSAPPEDLGYGLSLGAVDPASLGDSLRAAALQVARDPARATRVVGELVAEELAVGARTVRRLFGGNGDSRVEPDAGDRRFSDRAWHDNPFLRGTMESYLVWRRWSERVLEGTPLSDDRKRKARFAFSLWADAVSPTNVPWLNPAVVKEAIDTGGLSTVRGAATFVDDALRNGAMPRMVDTSSLRVGQELATTPGRVVFRNELFELLAYEPQTEQVHAEPLLYVPSWINKYYVLDLAPGRSFIEHAVGKGFTVFAISYRNPDASLADKTLDDYLHDGVLTAIDRAQELTGAARVNLIAVCVGGTMALSAAAILAARGQGERVGHVTLLNTLSDYSEPGDICVFTDERTIERIEERMHRRGYLSSEELSGPFTWMRGNDLVWRYVVSSWYQGKQPPAFDLLAWNDDGTRLPAAMHSQFLRACYLNNLLTKPGALELDGTPVDLGRIEAPVYVLTSESDHIAPWRSAYRTTQLVGGETRHVLARSGHVAGMVSPPGDPKAKYQVADETPADPEVWLAAAERVDGSWWEDWAAWAGERSGELVEPPTLPPGEPAPGTYVHG